MYNSRKWQRRDFPRLFRVGQAEKIGISRRRMLDEERCPIVLPGVRMDHSNTESLRAPEWADDSWIWDSLRLRAAVLKFPHVMADDATAARIFGWPLPPRLMNDRLYLCAADRNLRIRMAKVTLRRTQHLTPAHWLDLPVLVPAEVFIRLGAHLDVAELVQVGDAAIGNWHGPPQTTIDDLAAALESHSRLMGRQNLVKAVSLIRPGVDSPQETGLRLWAVRVGLPEPTVHPQIESDLARGIIEPDLGYEDARLALEYDSELHRESAKQWTRDIERDEALVDAGWTVLKVTRKTDYRQLEAKIRKKLGLQQL
ncbi:hypothetical protein [Brevibacterium sp. CFH 10365]|uniref:hypothetical protein n=1 Tax=Brevibacterium sp. CFH 10365 TaxID=2585207 RepID=UPI001D0D26BE|nr:hypothetical protein [Brevibacterium sp. CFH 10365]